MKNYKYHILYWGINYIIYCLSHFDSFSTTIYWYSLVIIFFNLCGYMIVFYNTLLYIIPFLWDKGKIFSSILSFLALMIIVFFLKMTIFSYLPVPEGDTSDSFTKVKILLFEMLMYCMYLPFAFVLWYVGKIEKEMETKSQIEKDNSRLEQAIVNTQLSNLKSQVNPDFLFHKLDYFYNESLAYSLSLSKGISLLTEMMHYAIDDEGENGKVPLEKEVKHIQNFIEINQLRFDGRLQVKFDIIGVNETQQIMPLILLTFVENAFKHGELFDVNNPFRITLKVEGNDLSFTTYNRTRRGPKEESEGIGINNTQKRLSLGYAENYSLNIKHEPEFYEVALSLNLDKHHDKLFNY